MYRAIRNPQETEWYHLSNAQKSGLKDHKVTEESWRKADVVSRQEWLEELKEDHYSNMRKLGKKEQTNLTSKKYY
jgi:hypothetical protein